MFYFKFKDKECFLKIKPIRDLFAIQPVLFSSSFVLRTFYPQPFTQFRIVLDTFHLLVDDSLGIRLYLVIITLYLLEHDVIPFTVLERVDNRDFL